MSARPSLRLIPNQPRDFNGLAAQMAASALHEIGPAKPGAEAASLGFALALAAPWIAAPGLIWAGEETLFAEEGAPYPLGLTQFGLDPAKLLVIRARKREEALWAAEQGLTASGAIVICALSAHRKPLDLKATRRLLLAAERHFSRCLLLKPEDGPSAAWTRWAIAPASSQGAARELGAPAFHATLTRHRAGASGQAFTLDWNPHARALAQRVFAEDGALAGALSAASGDGPAGARWASAG